MVNTRSYGWRDSPRLVDQDDCDIVFMASIEKPLLGTEMTFATRAKCTITVICGPSANDLREQFMTVGADYVLLKPSPAVQGALQREELGRIVCVAGSRAAEKGISVKISSCNGERKVIQ